MSQAVTLRLDDTITGAIQDLINVLHGPPPTYPPHITLTLGRKTPDIEDARARLARVAAHTDALSLSVSGFGIFPDGHGWLWLAPVTTPSLLALQAEVAEIIGLDSLDPHYHPGAWQPHITIERGATPIPDALSPLMHAWKGSLHGFAVRLEIVRFPPVTVVAGLPLRP
ncbi:2'-5' RNA ligase family protein [Zavarzinia compransoris]|uniref:2'-5' RNA ligase family protein n=1 Tax=Zavarzinia marina TaxID=2911065 RepID=UPI001F29F378|nr:2'-5' RNA ligase family protein [Zavarzinia marina]MCF4166817.1 2'-5' RNA ligase family protein [Zavarzinia marina]